MMFPKSYGTPVKLMEALTLTMLIIATIFPDFQTLFALFKLYFGIHFVPLFHKVCHSRTVFTYRSLFKGHGKLFTIGTKM